MKKATSLLVLSAALGTMEQPVKESFTSLLEQQAQAKQGTITAPTGADANLKTLGDASPLRDTLAGVVRSALQLATALKIAIINYGVRKAVIVPTGTNISSVIAAEETMELQGTFTKTDATKASSPWSFDDETGADGNIVDAIVGLIGTRLPSLTVESLTNGLEDIQENDAAVIAAGLKLIVIQDQAAGTVKLYSVETAGAANPHTAAVALAEDVQFVQTLDTTTAAQFGE